MILNIKQSTYAHYSYCLSSYRKTAVLPPLLANHSSQRKWASQVGKCSTQLSSNKSQRIDSWRDDTIEIRGDGLRRQLVQKTSGFLATWCSYQFAILDGTKADEIETAVAGRATEEDGVLEVHCKNLGGDIIIGVL
jgi:hypothetical protein